MTSGNLARAPVRSGCSQSLYRGMVMFVVLTFEHGDGAVVCLPTHGHTPGYQSVRIQTEMGGEFVIGLN